VRNTGIRTSFLALVIFAGQTLSFGQVITTIAGTEFVFPDPPMKAINAPLSVVTGVAVDRERNYYIADTTNNRVLRVDREGTLTLVAGNGIAGFSGDGGPATHASLQFPQGVAVDAAGNVYFSDGWNHRIRKVTTDGLIRTIAGTGNYAFGGDNGIGTSASVAIPQGVAVDSVGNVYIADMGNSRVRRVTPTGIITTIAGTGNFAFSGDGGRATSAAIGEVRSVAVDPAGNVYLSDSRNHRIRKIDTSGIITTIAGIGSAGFSGDGGAAVRANLNGPRGLSLDAAGNLYFADYSNNRIRLVSRTGNISTLAGSWLFSFTGDGGPATEALLANPSGTVVDPEGNILIADTENRRIRVISTSGKIDTIAGSGKYRNSGDEGPAVSASLHNISGLGTDRAGNILISDYHSANVRMITTDGIIHHVAGSGVKGYSGDNGPAAAAAMFGPYGLTADASGNILVADRVSGHVRQVSPAGIITTIAGTGALGWDGGMGGPAVKADLRAPRSLAFDAAANLWIGEAGGIKKISTSGIITRVAGSLGSNPGDGGPALSGAIGDAGAIAFDSAGNLYFTDSLNHRVRKITSGGTLTTLAGTGQPGYSGDGGLAKSALVNSPEGIAVDGEGNVYFGDASNHRVRVITPDGLIRTVAGTGIQGHTGDGGLATQATLDNPDSLTFDAAGNLLIGDPLNGRIRALLAKPPAVQVSPETVLINGRSGGPPVIVPPVSISSPVPGLAFSLTTTGGEGWLSVTPGEGAAPRQLEITADPLALAPGVYRAAVRISAPNAVPSSLELLLEFNVGEGADPRMALDKRSFSFTFPRSSARRGQSLSVINDGGGQLDFSAEALTETGGAWLSLDQGSGAATPGAPTVLEVSSDPGTLPPGTYRGQVIITAAGVRRGIPVTMTISAIDRAILLSKTGLSFTAVSNGGAVPPQTIGVLNIGQGLMEFTVETSTLTGNDWLIASPVAGASLAEGVPPLISVRVNPAGLPPDTYYGLVTVRAPGAANTPHVATVMLEVLPADADPGAIADPPELVFTTVAGSSPGSQDVFIYNPTARLKSYRAGRGGSTPEWLAFLPRDSSVLPEKPTSMVVQPLVAELPAGTHRGTITLQFDDGRVRVISVTVIVAEAGTLGSSKGGRSAGSDCVASTLLPVMTSLGLDFLVPAGWPVGLQVVVSDDCGRPMEKGTVVLEFSNGDPPLKLTSLRTGRWDGTWQTGSRHGAPVTVVVTAENSQLKIRGKREIAGGLGENRAPPTVLADGILSIADPSPFSPVAPGSFLALLGERLSQGQDRSQGAPWATQLAGAIITINEKRMPIQLAEDGRLIGMVPFGIEVNTNHQILAQRGATYSFPVPVDVAAAQPAVFLTEDGQPDIRDGDDRLIGEENPAAGRIRILCVGLGPVQPSLPAGEAGPSSPRAEVVEPVKLTVGGMAASVVFAGLAPDRVGLYLIEADLPTEISAGTAVPVVIEVAGQSSKAVSIAVR